MKKFHILCHLPISRLNGDGFVGNEIRIQTTGTTSVSTCRPAYCFQRTCGKSVLGTKVLESVLQISAGLLYSRCKICVLIFFYLLLSFCSRSFHSQIMRLVMAYQIVDQSINRYIYNVWETWGLPPHLIVVMSKYLHKRSVLNLFLTVVQSF